MKAQFCIGMFMLLCSGALAQESSSLSVTPDNSTAGMKVMNVSSQTIEAFEITYSCPDGNTSRKIYDVWFNIEHDKLIHPGGSATIPVGSRFAACPHSTPAVIFANGKSDGPPEEVAGLYARREAFAKELLFFTPLIGSVTTQGALQDMTAKVNQEKAAVLADKTISADERIGKLMAIRTVGDTLPRLSAEPKSATAQTSASPTSSERSAAKYHDYLANLVDKIRTDQSETSRPKF